MPIDTVREKIFWLLGTQNEAKKVKQPPAHKHVFKKKSIEKHCFLDHNTYILFERPIK